MSRPRVWLVAVGPEGLEALERLSESRLSGSETVALDLEGPHLRRSPARRKIPLPRGFAESASRQARSDLRERLAQEVGPGELALVLGEAAEDPPVALVAELLGELGARVVVVAVALSARRERLPERRTQRELAELGELIRTAAEGEAAALPGAVSVDLGSLTTVLAAAGLGRLSRAKQGGGDAGRWPPSRGRSWSSVDEILEPDREAPGAPPAPDAEMPDPAAAPAGDRVHFTVTSPAVVRLGSYFVLDVWAHLEEQRDEVLERAREAAAGAIRSRSKGPVAVARGTVLTVRLRLDGLEVDEPEDTLLWDGEIANASFPVYAPPGATRGEVPGLVTLHAGGLRVGKVHFTLRLEPEPQAAGARPVASGTALHGRAFASYASADRDQVLGRIQGMQKIVPRLEVFLDVLTLRSGQDWAGELERVIPEHDVFYLFWSGPASRSKWVEKEWRWALESRGLDFIDPVPLEPPQLVPPPKELASSHFNDWVLAFMSGRGFTSSAAR